MQRAAESEYTATRTGHRNDASTFRPEPAPPTPESLRAHPMGSAAWAGAHGRQPGTSC